MADVGTGALWATPGLPWEDVQLTRLVGRILVDDGRELDIYGTIHGGACVFVDEENRFCELTLEGHDLAWWFYRDCDTDYGEDLESLSWPEVQGDPQPAPRKRRHGLKGNTETRREAAESRQPIERIHRPDPRVRSPGAEKRLARERKKSLRR